MLNLLKTDLLEYIYVERAFDLNEAFITLIARKPTFSLQVIKLILNMSLLLKKING